MDWNIETLARRLQEAALEPALWPTVLDEMSRSVGAASAMLLSHRTRLPITPVSPELAPMIEEYFADEWHERSERRAAILRMRAPGTLVDQDFMTPDSMRNSAFYQEFLRRCGYAWFACIGFSVGRDLWCLVLNRTARQGPFEADDKLRLSMLINPLGDAATLCCSRSSARAAGMVDAFAHLEKACILFDERGKVITLNQYAEALIGDLIDKDGSLAFRDEQSRLCCSELLGRALRCESGPPRSSSRTVRNRQQLLLSLSIIPLRDTGTFSSIGARAMMLIEEQTTVAAWDASALRDRHGLTHAESRLASELCFGLSVRQAADKTGVKYETARSSLKSIFAKTNTHRQGELVALLVRPSI